MWFKRLFRRSICMVAVVLAVSAQARPDEPRPVKTVLGINWGTEDFPTSPIWDSAVQEVFQSRRDLAVDYFVEYLESDRFSAETASEALHDYIKRKFAGRRIDVVLANTDAAVQFAVRYRPQLFPDTPIVFGGTRLPDATLRDRPPGITGVLSGTGYRESLELALSLHPDTGRVLVIAQGPRNNTTFGELVRAELGPLANRVRLDYADARSLPELLSTVRSAPQRSLIYYLSYWHDEPGEIILPPKVAALVSEASPVPVYGILEVQMGSGIVGGVVRRTSVGARRMAELAIQILDGARAQDLPLEEAALEPMFDWRQLQRWRIDTSRLPANSEILFRTPTAWELYRWYIVAAGSVIVLQAVSIVALIVQKRRREQAERRERSTTTELRSSSQQIRRLAHDLITAQEEERSRLARELHDDIGQRIASLAIGLSVIKRRIDKGDPGVGAAAARLQQEIVELSHGLRQLSHEWHSGALEHVGLIEAVKARAHEVEAESGVAIRVDVAGGWVSPPDDVAMCLYRVAQESLRNIARHSRAREATVAFDRLGNAMTMRITDDGVGFNPLASGHQGLGLASMRERVQMVGGRFEIRSAPAAGTVAEAVVPTGGTS